MYIVVSFHLRSHRSKLIYPNYVFGSYKLQCLSSFPVCDNNDIVNIDYVLGWNKTLPYTRNPWRRPQDYKAYLLTNITVVAVKSDRLVIILNNVNPSSNNVKPSSNNVKPFKACSL